MAYHESSTRQRYAHHLAHLTQGRSVDAEQPEACASTSWATTVEGSESLPADWAQPSTRHRPPPPCATR